MLLTLPAACAFIFIAEPLVSTLFERGEFTNSATHASANALIAYAFGLPAYIIGKVFIPGYFARGDTKTPVKIATVSLIINTSLNLLLIGPYGHVGLAAATAISAWVNVILLYAGLRRKAYFFIETSTLINVLKYMVFAIIMGGALSYFAEYLTPYFQEGEALRILALSLLIVSGILVYFSGLFASGGLHIRDIRLITSKNR